MGSERIQYFFDTEFRAIGVLLVVVERCVAWVISAEVNTIGTNRIGLGNCLLWDTSHFLIFFVNKLWSAAEAGA